MSIVYCLSTLDSIQPPPFPNCLDPSNHDICEMNTGLQDIESTLQDFVDSYSLRNSTTSLRKKRALDSIGNFLNWCCSTATDGELHELTSNEEMVNHHLNSLQEIEKLDHEDLIKTSSQLTDFSTNVTKILNSVHTTLDKFQNSFKFGNKNIDTLYSNVLSLSLRTNIFLYKHIYISRFEEIHTHCKNHLIPQSLVPSKTLLLDLANLNDKLKPINYTLAIPLSELHQYYNIPLLSCISTPSNTILNVRIPVKSIRKSWTLYRYLPIPLAWKNQTCSLAHEDLILARSNSNTVLLVENNLKTVM